VPDCLASRPTYLYSVGSSLILADVVIDAERSDVIRAWPRVVLSGRRRVQSLATHVDRALVYFGDTNTGAVYRTKRNEWNVIELTVQQPHVEGKLAICTEWSTKKYAVYYYYKPNFKTAYRFSSNLAYSLNNDCLITWFKTIHFTCLVYPYYLVMLRELQNCDKIA